MGNFGELAGFALLLLVFLFDGFGDGSGVDAGLFGVNLPELRVIFDAVFRPTTVEDTRETVAEHFRTAIRREKERVHLVDRLVFQPTRAAALGFARCLAAMHHGRINAYITYALLTLLIVWIVFSLVPAS